MREISGTLRDAAASLAARVRGSLLATSPLALLAAALFLALALPVLLLEQGERSSYVANANPTNASPLHGSNPFLGYTATWGERPVHKENAPSLEQVLFFAGEPVALDLFVSRPYYPFVAAHLEPLLGVWGGLVAANGLAWAICAAVAFALARRLAGGDALAGLVACVLVAVGTGTTVHAGDLSAHLAGHASSFVVALALHESGVWRETRPLATHLRLGLGFAVAGLVYSTGVTLALAYAVLALPRNRWPHVALALALAVAPRLLWAKVFNWTAFAIGGRSTPLDIFQIEGELTRGSLHFWRSAPLTESVPFVLETLARDLLLETPWVVLLGLLGLARPLRADPLLRRLVLAVVGVPVAASLALQAPVGDARGYVVYGASVFLYAGAGVLVARAWRAASSRGRAGLALGLVLLLGAQLAWDHAHLAGVWGPIKAYYMGLPPADPLFRTRPAILSLTGQEPTPVLFGGRASLVEAGLAVFSPARRVYPNLWGILLARAYLLALLAAFAVSLAATWRERALALGTVAVLALVPAWRTIRTFEEAPVVRNVDEALELPAHARGSLTVRLAPSFLEKLSSAARPGDRLELLLRARRVAVRARAGEAPLELAAGPLPELWSLPLEPSLALLRASGSLTVELETGEAAVHVTGWQRRDLAGRTLEGPWSGLPVLPIFELRLRGEDGTLRVGGF